MGRGLYLHMVMPLSTSERGQLPPQPLKRDWGCDRGQGRRLRSSPCSFFRERGLDLDLFLGLEG